MNRIPFIDLHQDIADNCLILSGKEFLIKNSLHEGSNNVGLPVNNQVDLVRLKQSGVRLVVGAACPLSIVNEEMKLTERPEKETERQIEFYLDILRKTDEIRMVKNWKDYQQAIIDKAIGLLVHIEGADGINVEKLDQFHHQGVRSVGLTHNDANEFAGGANSDGNLTSEGIGLIEQAHSLGMIVDLAHLNRASFDEVIKIVEPPFMFSHGGIAIDRNIPRNLADDQIMSIAEKGGIFGVTFAPNLLSGNSLDVVVGIFQHLKQLVGTEAIALGSDFDGMISKELVDGLEDVTKLENLSDLLGENGFSAREIENIFYKNAEKRLFRLLAS